MPIRASLSELLASDLPEHRHAPAGPGRSRFTPVQGGPVLEITQRVERRFLGRTTIAQFHTAFAGPCDGGLLELRHTGARRRTGIEATVREGSGLPTKVADQIRSDRALVEALLPLDFTRFELRCEDGVWSVTVELMGASLVAIALPPIRSYVRLYPDQKEALIGSLTRLNQLLGQTSPDSYL